MPPYLQKYFGNLSFYSFLFYYFKEQYLYCLKWGKVQQGSGQHWDNMDIGKFFLPVNWETKKRWNISRHCSWGQRMFKTAATWIRKKMIQFCNTIWTVFYFNGIHCLLEFTAKPQNYPETFIYFYLALHIKWFSV